MSRFEGFDTSSSENMAMNLRDLTFTLPSSISLPVTMEIVATDEVGKVVARHVISFATHGDMAQFSLALWKLTQRSTLLDMSRKK